MYLIFLISDRVIGFEIPHAPSTKRRGLPCSAPHHGQRDGRVHSPSPVACDARFPPPHRRSLRRTCLLVTPPQLPLKASVKREVSESTSGSASPHEEPGGEGGAAAKEPAFASESARQKAVGEEWTKLLTQLVQVVHPDQASGTVASASPNMRVH